MNNKITIVDNSIIYANAMGMFVESIFQKQLLAKLTFNDELLKKFQNNVPDIALISFDNNNEGQINSINELMEEFPQTSFIALCEKKDNKYHSYVKKYGFKGFINKINFIKDFKAAMDSFEIAQA